MNQYPSDERSISEVERGRSHDAVLPIDPGMIPVAGDSVLFALSLNPMAREPRFVMGGDSVRVLLTGVTDLGETDPATGFSLFRLAWEPLGQWVPASPRPKGRKVRVP